MASKRCRNLVLLNEGEKTMCPQQVQLSASLMNQKQRNAVAGEGENPPENSSRRSAVEGQELGKEEKQTGKCIFELGLPAVSPVEMMMIRNRVGHFLEACYWCKKKLKYSKDVYMYG
ncbi:hypothetical protein L6164_012773 [Bauhinia variegata]|uniref:Uncharacterized protein n=1 Tax=Bauhinia variegata TaxID=167791 RepID=A0ACB9PB51_BAUVA|nr:hypothetical protein L6164_012773 [Bauhinia variegata]